MSIGHAMDFFNNLKLSGQRAQIAEKVLKEIGDRLKFLVNVGLNYLTLSRSAETLRRRSPAYPSGEPDWRGPGRRDVRAG
jgi:excinuclease UvrABC ATPase subunit